MHVLCKNQLSFCRKMTENIQTRLFYRGEHSNPDESKQTNCGPECDGQCCENLCIPKDSKLSCQNNLIAIDTANGKMEVCKHFCKRSMFPEGTFGRVDIDELNNIVDVSKDTVTCSCYNPMLDKKSLVNTFNIDEQPVFGSSPVQAQDKTWIIILALVLTVLSIIILN
jgi:hypothetical protein